MLINFHVYEMQPDWERVRKKTLITYLPGFLRFSFFSSSDYSWHNPLKWLQKKTMMFELKGSQWQ